MESKREQTFVGIFVIVAAGILLFTMLYISGTFRGSGPLYKGYFNNAGGLQKGGQVRYAGGPPIGRITEVKPDPQDPTRMEIEFRVEPQVPVKTDSKVKISSLSPLGENFLAIVPGTKAAPRAEEGKILDSVEYVGFDDLEAKMNDLAPDAKELIGNMNKRLADLKITIANVNALLDEENRANIARALKNVNGMLEEDRKPLNSALKNVNDLTEKVKPLIDNMKNTLAKADQAIEDADKMIKNDEPLVHTDLEKLHDTLNSMASLSDQLDRTLNVNSGNLDEIIENLRQISENMKEFTETIKTRPYTLIRSSEPKPRKPGEAPPQ